MAFPGKDGKPYSSQMQAFQAKPAPAAPPADPGADPTAGKPSIQDDPEAMKLVDQLSQMGYTGEDVEMAMGGMGGGADQMGAGKEATAAAPLQIPGLQ